MKAKKYFFLSSALLIIVLLMSVSANAALVDGFSGWTEMSECDYCDSIVNFSVYENTDGDWTDDPFFNVVGDVGFVNQYGTFDNNAKYVYMYQLVNVNTSGSINEQDIQKFSVASASINITSGGYFDNTVFHDGSDTISGVNWSLSNPNPGSFPGDDYIDSVTGLGDGMPSAAVSTLNVSLAADASSQDSYSLYSNLGGCPSPTAPCNVMIYNFPSNTHQIEHLTDEYTSVLYMTSNIAPTYGFGETEAGQGSGADGEIPTVVPEPVSSVLFLIGGVTLGFRRFRKKA